MFQVPLPVKGFIAFPFLMTSTVCPATRDKLELSWMGYEMSKPDNTYNPWCLHGSKA